MKKIWILIICIALGVLLWWILVNIPQGALRPTKDSAEPPQTPTRLVARVTDPSIGRRDAPITIITASSFGCPSCKDSAVILDQVLALYPDTVRVVWKDLPDTVGDSYRAAIAARCAQQQGKFWPYHDLLFQKQDIAATNAFYSLWARDLDLREQLFKDCFDGQLTQNLVNANVNETLGIGISRVPYFQINDLDGIAGNQTLGYFKGVIEMLLKTNASAVN